MPNKRNRRSLRNQHHQFPKTTLWKTPTKMLTKKMKTFWAKKARVRIRAFETNFSRV